MSDVSILEAMQGLPRLYKTLCGIAGLGTLRRIQKAKPGLQPDVLYTPKEAARFLGVKNVGYIKEPLLPRTKQPQGRIRGIWIMAYQGLVSYDEARMYEQALAAQATSFLNGAALHEAA